MWGGGRGGWACESCGVALVVVHRPKANDLAFCHLCTLAYRGGKLSSSKLNKAFVVNEFGSWKDVWHLEHSSNGHHEGVEKIKKIS